MAPCCIKGCKNRGEKRTKKNSGITYHLFPRNVAKRRKWMEALDRKGWLPSNATVVCSKHFEDSCFYTTQNGLKKLLNDAVPSINIHIDKQSHQNSEMNTISTVIPELPEITDDSPKTKQLVAQLRKLCLIYELQKKKIRNLRQKLRRQKMKLQVDYLQVQSLKRKKMKILKVNIDMDLLAEHNDCMQMDPLS